MTSFLPGHNHKDRNITNNFDLSKANHQHHHLGRKFLPLPLHWIVI